LEGAEKPGNLGAVARSADAAGLAAILLADSRVDPFNPNAIRASLGTVFALPIVVEPGERVHDWLRQSGLCIAAARVDGMVPYTQTNFRGPTAIVLGSEAHGLSDRWRGVDVVAVSIPMCGVGDSLNLSATAAVLFYEALRQRDASTPRSHAAK
jgi:TrmH family RNA methyltransferase